MRPYLQGLLTRMAAKCTEPDSSKSVSWVAHREAERLNDLTMVDELSDHLQAEQVRQRRLACLFIIGKLGANQAHYDCAEIILAALAQEQDKYVLSAALDLIRDIPKPASVNLSFVYDLLADPRWLVRHAAIRALEGSEASASEDCVLHLLSTTTDADDQIYCHSTLNRIGTARSIPHLEKGAESRKRDVRMSAQSALAAIQERMRSEARR